MQTLLLDTFAALWSENTNVDEGRIPSNENLEIWSHPIRNKHARYDERFLPKIRKTFASARKTLVCGRVFEPVSVYSLFVLGAGDA